MNKHNQQILPGSTIGIIGEGQLGKMLAMKALQMGYKIIIYGNQLEGVAYSCCHKKYICPESEGGYTNIVLLEQFGKECDVVLIEFENIPTETLEFLSQFTRVCPGPEVLKVTQDRFLEKELCHGLNIGTAKTIPIFSLDQLQKLEASQFPVILKTRRLGYDGKGQQVCSNTEEAEKAWWSLRKNGNETFVYEGFVDFICEVSVIVARNEYGLTVSLPLVQNVHENGILRKTTFPAPITQRHATLENEAIALAQTIAQELTVVGLIAVEMFITKDYKILVNELAPRPHNSGHWSIDACDIDQYEMYIRAACNLPMLHPKPHSQATMTNLLGSEVMDPILFSIDNCVHIYGKTEIKNGRKMGHVTQLTPFKK